MKLCKSEQIWNLIYLGGCEIMFCWSEFDFQSL